MYDTHDRAPDTSGALEQILEFRKELEAGFARLDLRIDHLIGRHDGAFDAVGCEACEVRRAG